MVAEDLHLMDEGGLHLMDEEDLPRMVVEDPLQRDVGDLHLMEEEDLHQKDVEDPHLKDVVDHQKAIAAALMIDDHLKMVRGHEDHHLDMKKGRMSLFSQIYIYVAVNILSDFFCQLLSY